MNDIRLGKSVGEQCDWFKSAEAVGTLYQHDVGQYDDDGFKLKIRDFLTAYDECDVECQRKWTAQHLMGNIESYKAMWGGTDVTITEKDRYKGVGIFGSPGGGKSVAILNMCNEDLLMGMTALCLIDPSGQLAREVYSLAKSYKCDVTYLSKENPCMGLNLMMAPYSKEQIAELVLAFLNHITLTTSSDNTVTTRMRNAVYDVVLWCIDKNRPRLDAVLDKLRLKRDPKNQFAIDGVIARLESILSDPAVHKILCNEESINWEDFITNKKVLIVDTFGFGDLPKTALGSALTFLIKENFMAIRREEYHPLALYVDEAHKFVSDDTFNDFLKMGRKFLLALTIATQDMATIPRVFGHVMLSNLGTFIAFNPGMTEASYISKEFRDMDAHAVKFTDEYHAAVKTPTFEGIVKMNAPPFVEDLPLPVYEVATHPMWF